ncbi:MAG: hypothetical protein WCO98_10430 [bacterium]
MNGFQIMQIILPVMMIFFIVMAVREVIIYRRGDVGVYSFRRLSVRLSMAVMVIFLLGSILTVISVPWFYLIEPQTTPNLWFAYWGSVAMLSFGILSLIVADFHMIGDDTRQDENKMWRELAEVIAQHEKMKEGKKDDE